MLCPRGRAFRGCPTSGSLTFLLMFFFSFFLCHFFSHLARDLKSRITVCTLSLPSWKGATGKVSPQVLQPRCPRLKQYQNLQLKLLLETSGLEIPFVSAPATFTISSRGGRKYLKVKRNVLKSCPTSETVLIFTPFSPHIRATSRASFTIVPFHLAHVSLTANHVKSSRILSPPLFRSVSPMVLSPCRERWENAHLRIWLCH